MSDTGAHREVDAWFLERGFRLSEPRHEGSEYWVDIVKASSGETLWSRFGRGLTKQDAMANARRRYQQEQEGGFR